MKKGQLIKVCPECFSRDIHHTVPISRGKSYIKRCGYCNTEFAPSEILIIDKDGAVRKRQNWLMDNRGYVRMKGGLT